MNIDIHDLPRLMANPASPDAVALVAQLQNRVVYFDKQPWTVAMWRQQIEELISYHVSAGNEAPPIALNDHDAVPCIRLSRLESMEAERLTRQLRSLGLHRNVVRPQPVIVGTTRHFGYKTTTAENIISLGRLPQWVWQSMLSALYAIGLVSLTDLVSGASQMVLVLGALTVIFFTHQLKAEARQCRTMLVEDQWAEYLLGADPNKADLVIASDEMLYQWIRLYAGDDPNKTPAALEAWHAAWSDPVGFRHMRRVSSMYTQMNRLPSGGDSDSMQDKINEALSFVIARTSTGELGHTKPEPPSLHEWKEAGLEQHPAESEDHLR